MLRNRWVAIGVAFLRYSHCLLPLRNLLSQELITFSTYDFGSLAFRRDTLEMLYPFLNRLIG